MRFFFKPFFFVLLFLASGSINAQTYFDGKFRVKGYTNSNAQYTLYDFSRESNTMKLKYFATNAYAQYLAWKGDKRILLVTAGAFSDSWQADGKPVGLCVDNGTIVNRTPDNVMDGMVIVFNGGSQQGGIGVVDLDMKPVTVEEPYGSGTRVSYYPRSSAVDRLNFLNWGKTNGITLFQTQLMYSSDRNANLTNLYYGEKRERRFLATCRKNGVIHHVVVNASTALELNLSASYAKTVLEYDGFTVLYIMNLDTGCKNILYAYNGSYLENLDPASGSGCGDAVISSATNLIVYYKD